MFYFIGAFVLILLGFWQHEQAENYRKVAFKYGDQTNNPQRVIAMYFILALPYMMWLVALILLLIGFFGGVV